MSNIPKLKSIEEREAFAKIMADPHRLGLSTAQIAEKFSMTVPSIYNYLKQPDICKMIKEERSKRMSSELPEVDDALMRAAKKGDVRAIELLYERWDDYVKRSKQEIGVLENEEAEAEKNARLMRLKSFLNEIGVGKKETPNHAVTPTSEVNSSTEKSA